MSWRPNSGAAVAAARAQMLERVRDYFRDQEALEVFTPAMTACAVTDAHIDSIATRSAIGDGFLHTSPEYAMKRLLAAGYPDIYQVCRVFRDGEAGRLHLPEFTMIEWYRRGFSLTDIIDDCLALVTRMCARRRAGSTLRVSYRDVFRETLGVDPLAADAGGIADALDADAALRDSLGDDRDAWLDLAMSTRIAPGFPAERLTAIFHFPTSQASLARLCPDDAQVADRFELYFGNVELANGFVELLDRDEQLARFESDRLARQRLGKPVPAIDPQLIDALEAGLPECAGVALGLDRTLMIDQGLDDIHKVTTFTPGR